ncbi:Uncharacterised protein [Vibrio cholerae]|nr:Uncharacterised protein [Vibrio cholerae]
MKEGIGSDFIANASARPITIQLVIIRPTNTDSCLEISYRYAFRIWSTTITNEAIIAICTIIRTLLGMWLRIRETKKLDNAVTNITASVITNAVSSLVVTASAEHTPRTCSAIGLLSKTGANTLFFSSFALDIS